VSRKQDRRVVDRRVDERRTKVRLGQDRRERERRGNGVRIAGATEEVPRAAWLEAMVEHEISGAR
jgi:hypothetical protein